MPPTPANSVVQGSFANVATATGRLRRGQAVILAGLGILLWFTAALSIRYGIPADLFGGRAGIVLFTLNVPLAPVGGPVATDTVGEFASGLVQAAMRRTRREVRVAARASPRAHALSRTTFRAAAVATCCRWVLASPT